MMNDVYEKFLKSSEEFIFAENKPEKSDIILSLEMVIRRWRKKQQNCLRKGWRTGFCPVENTA